MGKIKPLKENPLFKDFSDKEIALLAKFVDEKTIKAPAPLFIENMKGESMFILVAGQIRLSKMIAEGEEKTLSTVGPGEFFGEMALVEDGPRAVTAFVVADSNILIIKRGSFESLMKESPKVAVKVAIGLYKTLSDRIRTLSPEIQQMIVGKSGS